MTQAFLGQIPPLPTAYTGEDLAEAWNAFDTAHKSGQMGIVRPAGLEDGGTWSRYNDDGTRSLMIYNGAEDEEVGALMRESVSITAPQAAAAVDITGVETIRIDYWDFVPGTAHAVLMMRCGSGGSGGSFVSSLSYVTQLIRGRGATAPIAAEGTGTQFAIGVEQSTINYGSGSASFFGFNSTGFIQGVGQFFGVDNTGVNSLDERGFRLQSAINCNALQFFASTGNIDRLQLRVCEI